MTTDASITTIITATTTTTTTTTYSSSATSSSSTSTSSSTTTNTTAVSIPITITSTTAPTTTAVVITLVCFWFVCKLWRLVTSTNWSRVGLGLRQSCSTETFCAASTRFFLNRINATFRLAVATDVRAPSGGSSSSSSSSSSDSSKSSNANFTLCFQ